jgi:hypothetical protein
MLMKMFKQGLSLCLIACGWSFYTNDTNNLTIMSKRQMSSRKVKWQCILDRSDYEADNWNFTSLKAVLGGPIAKLSFIR